MIRPAMVRIGVLGSGKGSNFKALLDARREGSLPAEFVIVASDNPRAGILDLAKGAGIPCHLIEEPAFRTRLSPGVEERLAGALRDAGCEMLVLAGYMRMVKAPLLDAFPDRILNIHPSLLPAFPGLDAWRQALEAGALHSGCTVHMVDSGMDTGRILAQRTVPVLPGDTPGSLHARIQQAEHELLPATVAAFCRSLGKNA
jgi:phosphoribosylglycinamide formyltransferase 1